jgi:hypothetical protein
VCAARLGDGDMWCAQCHTDLRPAPPVRRRGPSGRRARALPTDLPAATPLGPEESAALAAEWARRLAETERGAGVPGLVARTGSAGGRAAVALGVGLGLVAVLLLVMVAAGALL